MSFLVVAIALGFPSKPAPFAGGWEVRYTDGSVMKVGLLDEQLALATPYGPLNIPFRDVKRIEVGIRLNADTQKALDAALADAAGTDAAKRALARDALLAIGAKALPAVRRAQKGAAEEAGPTLADVAAKLQALLPDPKSEPKDYDVAVTDDSRFAGRIQAPVLRIDTAQFGELKLRVADAASIHQGAGPADVKYELVEGKGIMELLGSHMGKTVGLRATGAVRGAVWGSGPFTGDSDLATAAVFAGALKVGETAIVKVKLVPSPGVFAAGNANGVATNQFGNFPTGAYEIVK